jgi:hypothetical protein
MISDDVLGVGSKAGSTYLVHQSAPFGASIHEADRTSEPK